MTMKRRQLLLIFTVSAIFFNGCIDYLELKSNQSLVVPHTLQDLDALLNNSDVMNANTPNLGEVSAGESYATTSAWQYFDSENKAIYLWQKDLTILSPIHLECWSEPYRQILYSNIVLEGIEKIDPNNAEITTWKRIKGSALFYRAWALSQLMAVFCEAYDPAKADNQMGIPLRITSAVEQDLPRASLSTCYKQIISDLNTATLLLPVQASVKTQPDQAAALALLSRIYLFMKDYEQALKYADACLEKQNELIDYSELDTAAKYPFNQFNPEVIFHSTIKRHLTLPHSGSFAYTSNELFQLYDEYDLRKLLFFDVDNEGLVSFKGSYDGSQDFFTGLAIDEVYLTKAECLAHSGQVAAAIDVLNELLKTRYPKQDFRPFQASSLTETLEVILMNRRKQLVFRGIRWPDIKRLTVAGLFNDTLKRNFNGETYTLPPADKRYVLPIPQMVIERSGIKQNDR